MLEQYSRSLISPIVRVICHFNPRGKFVKVSEGYLSKLNNSAVVSKMSSLKILLVVVFRLFSCFFF